MSVVLTPNVLYVVSLEVKEALTLADIPYTALRALQFFQHGRRISLKILHKNSLQFWIRNRQLPSRKRNQGRYTRVLETLPQDFFADEAAGAREDDLHDCGGKTFLAFPFMGLIAFGDIDYGILFVSRFGSSMRRYSRALWKPLLSKSNLLDQT